MHHRISYDHAQHAKHAVCLPPLPPALRCAVPSIDGAGTRRAVCRHQPQGATEAASLVSAGEWQRRGTVLRGGATYSETWWCPDTCGQAAGGALAYPTVIGWGCMTALLACRVVFLHDLTTETASKGICSPALPLRFAFPELMASGLCSLYCSMGRNHASNSTPFCQAETLGNLFRNVMYPPSAGGGLLRLHSTYRHDLKIYSSGGSGAARCHVVVCGQYECDMAVTCQGCSRSCWPHACSWCLACC